MSILLVGISAAPFAQSIVTPYTVASAHWAGSILHWFGLKARVADNMLIWSSFSITVLRECTAVELFAFLAAGLLAFPSTLFQKLAGVLSSALWVAALNLIRIVTVFIAGVYRPDLFDALHEDVWAILLTGSMVVFAVVWVRWVSGTPKPAIPQG
jgi:exosortase/archaeosortase family protein